VEDPPDRPPRSPVIQIGSGPSRQIVLNVAHVGVRRYLPDKDQWLPLPSKDVTSVLSFAANSELIIAGLVVSRWDVEFKDGLPTRTNVTAPEFDRMLEDPTLFKRIKGRKQVWQPALGIYDSSNGPPQIVADDGSLPANPQLLVLEGTDLIVTGEAYIAIYDLKQMRVRTLAHISARTVDKIQVGAGFLWVQFDRHLYRAALTAIQYTNRR
jgi:hypothetical protein